MNKALLILCLTVMAQTSFGQETIVDSTSVQNERKLNACFENIDNASSRDVKIYYESYIVKYREEPTEFNRAVLEYLKQKIKEN